MATVTGSPNVSFKEQDLSTVVSSSSTTVGALVGIFQWGQAEEPFLVTSEANLVKYFGYPDDNNYKDWFTARNFLNYSNALRLCRVVSANTVNACNVVAEATQIKNSSEFANLQGTLGGENKTAKIFARYPGSYGNNIRVVIADKSAINKVDATSGTKNNPLVPYVSKIMDDNDVAYGVFVNDSLVEFGMCSFVSDNLDINGYKNYLPTYINTRSSYIYVIPNKLITYQQNGNRTPIDIDVQLSGGVDGTVENSDYFRGWNLFKNSDVYDVSILMQGGGNIDVGVHIIKTIAASRRDCVACVSPLEEDVVYTNNKVINLTTEHPMVINGETTNTSYQALYNGTSYSFMDGNYKYQYDSYNNCYRWLPLNGDIAGLMAITDEESAPWFSPANKVIRDVTKLAFYPDKPERDELYRCLINPVTAFNEEGYVLYGDWTGVANTKFNFVGVRRLFIYMEKQIAKYARRVMFQQNDEFTQSEFMQSVDPFLAEIQGGRGISDYRIYCDSTVNTPQVVDEGQFVAKIAVKPINSIRWVTLTFVATRSDVSFDEIVESGIGE